MLQTTESAKTGERPNWSGSSRNMFFYDGHWYVPVYGQPASWEEANRDSLDSWWTINGVLWRGSLAWIATAEENEAIRARLVELDAGSDHWWIGWSPSGAWSAGEEIHWSNGEVSSFWSGDAQGPWQQADDPRGVALNRVTGKWEVAAGDHSWPWVVKLTQQA